MRKIAHEEIENIKSGVCGWFLPFGTKSSTFMSTVYRS